MDQSPPAIPSMPLEVVVFHTPGCGRCQAAADFFRQRGFEVNMLDVANDFGALRRMARLCPGERSVPVILWGQEVFVGFDPAYWRQRLEGQP
ncbi:MAG: glutaredoxin family protein [Desulfarculus sp.]|nr:glutaredoxin family protein [Desulfarculus sp.]